MAGDGEVKGLGEGDVSGGTVGVVVGFCVDEVVVVGVGVVSVCGVWVAVGVISPIVMVCVLLQPLVEPVKTYGHISNMFVPFGSCVRCTYPTYACT